MLENRRDSLQRQIANLGRQQGIEAVRRLQQGGHASSSPPTRPRSAAPSTSTPRPATSATPRAARSSGSSTLARSRIFAPPDGHRVLGIINPIQNQPGCSARLPRPRPARQRAGRARRDAVARERRPAASPGERWRMVGLAVAAILGERRDAVVAEPTAGAAARWRRSAQGTRRVAAGDLSTADPGHARATSSAISRAPSTR